MLESLARLPAGDPDRQRHREAAIRAFLPLARRLAHRYAHTSEDPQDLVQVATVALICAVDRYDPEHGNFYAYAVPTIRGELKRYFRDRCWMIQPPRSIQELRHGINGARQRLVGELGRTPTVPELAAAVGTSVSRVREAIGAGQGYQPVSLNLSCPGPDGTGGTELAELIGGPDPAVESVPERVSLPGALAQLTDRDRAVIVQRFVHRRTQVQIGRSLGISQMHVSRLIARALAQLRAYLEGAEPVPPVTPRLRGGHRQAA
ncbi:RNA polymerase sigma factor [Actinocatenispora thailandica]|uniref:RNA polymerase sigma factor n=1 Tax=Actinocatenispora thailandica TaxID=227318 RepID=A0A7R7DKR8_9ACTN|nr:RNA polymerase sigma factor [Actinocatenispora thailandica]